MKAVRVNQYGTSVVIEDMPQPKPAADEALIRVHAASINPFDTAVMAGYLAFMTSVPMTLGTDYSGEVVEVGKDVTHVKRGDLVYGLIPAGAGTFAEYTVAKANQVALKPKSLDHNHASTIPLPAMAAWQSLFELGKYQNGERVLIHGVGGAVGGLAAQMAKGRGAYVYGTDIPEKTAHIAAFGIDRFIDVSKERFEDVVGHVDIVLDYIGGEYMQRSYNVLKPGGRYVTSLVMTTDQEEVKKRLISSAGLASEARAELLATIAEMVDAGKLKVFVNRIYPLDQTQAALDHRLASKNPGKVVIKVL